MSSPYAYTPYIWPMLATAVVVIVLGAHAWRRRYIAAAVPFVLLTLLWAVYALASALELAAVDEGTKFLWFQVQAFVKLPAVTSALIFVLAYTGLNPWINRTTLALLALPCIVVPVIILTNSADQLFFTSVSFTMTTEVTYGPAMWAAAAYIYLLFLLQVAVLVGFWFRSPLSRWPTFLMIGAGLVVRIAGIADVLGINPVAPLDMTILFSSLPAIAYFLALFRFRILDVVPVGREAAFEDMTIGLLILDADNRIADINPAAQRLLALSLSSAVGRTAEDALAAFPNIIQFLGQDGSGRAEVTLDEPAPARSCHVDASVLTDRHGFDVGRLVLIQDVTEQKRTRELVLQQQRTLAIVEERERLARELHDGLGQMLAAAHLQASTAQRLLAQGANAQAVECLDQLAEMTLDAEADVREYLLGAKTVFSANRPFFAALREYLTRFSQRYGLQVELTESQELEEHALAPAAEVQLMRVIQEALSNIRKHARAHCAQVSFAVVGAQVRVLIADDGEGFDPAAVDSRLGGFGLQSMRERVEGVGGRLVITSSPGQGTRVAVLVPRTG